MVSKVLAGHIDETLNKWWLNSKPCNFINRYNDISVKARCEIVHTLWSTNWMYVCVQINSVRTTHTNTHNIQSGLYNVYVFFVVPTWDVKKRRDMFGTIYVISGVI